MWKDIQKSCSCQLNFDSILKSNSFSETEMRSIWSHLQDFMSQVPENLLRFKKIFSI